MVIPMDASSCHVDSHISILTPYFTSTSNYMSSSNNVSLQESLQALYDYLGNMRLSLELIRKLAKHLKLDTYVDSDIQPTSTGSGPPKRLSIAGANLLLDIDFAGEHNVTAVALSVGSLTPQSSQAPKLETTSMPSDIDAAQFVKGETDIDDVTTVRLDFTGDGADSFLGRSACHEAEKILLSSLSGEYLGSFPQNLKYLSQLDQEQFSGGKLITSVDKIAWFLSAVHYQECQYNGEEADIKDGWTSRFGKVTLNDLALNKIGIFLQFWKSLRRLLLAGLEGKVHKALLSLVSPDLLESYIEREKETIWRLQDVKGNATKLYKFDFDLPGPVIPSESFSLGLALQLDEPIYVAKQVLEYLDVLFTQPLHIKPCKALELLMECGSILFADKAEGPGILFSLEDASSFIPIDTVNLNLLKQLADVMPVFRNFLTFRELLESVNVSSSYEVALAASLSSDANKKLRDRLKLLKDVPNEELVGFSAFSADYLNAPILESTTSLQEFVKEESPREGDSMVKTDSSGEVSQTPLSKLLLFSVVDIWYESINFDLIILVSGQISQNESILKRFKIANGVMQEYTNTQLEEDAMQIDDDLRVIQDFCKALSFSNNVPLTLQAIQS